MKRHFRTKSGGYADPADSARKGSSWSPFLQGGGAHKFPAERCTLAPLGHLHPPLPSRRELGGCQGPANMQFLRPQSKEDIISLGWFVPRDKLVFVAVVFSTIHTISEFAATGQGLRGGDRQENSP